jgi:hypothetical protein
VNLTPNTRAWGKLRTDEEEGDVLVPRTASYVQGRLAGGRVGDVDQQARLVQQRADGADVPSPRCDVQRVASSPLLVRAENNKVNK